MPYRRYYRKKRPYFKRKSSNWRLSGWKRRKSNNAARKGKKVYYFTRYFDAGSILSDNSLETIGSLVFKLTDVPGYTEFTGLFDEYKISAVKIMFMSPGVTTINNQTGGAPSFVIPMLYTCLDYTDDDVTLDIQDIREYQTAKIHHITKRMNSRYLKPCFQTLVYEGVGQGYTPKRGWLNTNDSSVEHYAIKYGLEPTGGTVDNRYEIKIVCKYYLAFRNSK